MEASQVSPTKAVDGPITFEVPLAERAALEELAQLRGGSVAGAIRQALINDKFIRDRLKEGVELVLRNPDGQLVKLNWS